jgi:hypothetical protein
MIAFIVDNVDAAIAGLQVLKGWMKGHAGTVSVLGREFVDDSSKQVLATVDDIATVQQVTGVDQ